MEYEQQEDLKVVTGKIGYLKWTQQNVYTFKTYIIITVITIIIIIIIKF